MLRCIISLCPLSFSLLALFCISPTASAQVVQLPTFEMFGVGTTVSVPDRGSMLLGGVNRSGSFSNQRGIPGLGRLPFGGRGFGNRAIGSNLSGGSARVHATVHDLQAMDRAILSQAGSSQSTGDLTLSSMRNQYRKQKPTYQKPSDSKLNDSSSATKPADSLAAIREQQSGALSPAEEKALLNWQKAQTAKALGKYGLAKMYYRVVAKYGQGNLQAKAKAEIELLSKPKTSRSK